MICLQLSTRETLHTMYCYGTIVSTITNRCSISVIVY